MLLLTTSLAKGLAYVETKNLDGETNLKHKQANKNLIALSSGPNGFDPTRIEDCSVICEKENDSIYTF